MSLRTTSLLPLPGTQITIWLPRTAILGKGINLANTEVTVYIREHLGLTVHDAKEAGNHLSGESP